MELDGINRIALLSVGTDGTDGPTDAARGLVDGARACMARVLGMDPVDYLQRNDSFPILEKTGSLVKTGPNVMDVQIVLIA
ncbi:MAG: hypothetical protein FJ215_07480 [Ignavibacteria bacterium]|nr:hypothetical protein [Ignavibacteria bacterium]